MAECDWCNDKDPLCAQRLCTAHPGMRGCCAGCVTEQLRADLATVTAERDQAREGWKTTSALAVETQNDLEATRAELAKAEERVKALESRIKAAPGGGWTCD